MKSLFLRHYIFQPFSDSWEIFATRDFLAGCRDAINYDRSKIAGARTAAPFADLYGKLGALIATIDRHCSSGTYVRKTRRMLDRAPCHAPTRHVQHFIAPWKLTASSVHVVSVFLSSIFEPREIRGTRVKIQWQWKQEIRRRRYGRRFHNGFESI